MSREKYNIEPKDFDLPLKRMTLNQQRDACQMEITKLKEENMQLGLEVILLIGSQSESIEEYYPFDRIAALSEVC